jgi:uncharacterized protein DUF5335
MNSRHIPKDQWCSELDTFSRQHEGWIVNVHVSTPDGEMRMEAHDRPLVGVSCDAPKGDRIDVMTGDRPDDHLTHVERAVAIAIDETDTGAERALRIRGADGSEMLVEFRSPMRAEDVDGMPQR